MSVGFLGGMGGIGLEWRDQIFYGDGGFFEFRFAFSNCEVYMKINRLENFWRRQLLGDILIYYYI